MSVFKTHWIILKTQKLKESEFLLDVFCYDYGKLKLKTKKSKDYKTLDIWYNINFEINVKKENQIHEIKNVKIKNEFDYLQKDYETILEYLKIIKIVLEKTPEHQEIKEIYNILNEINTFLNITKEKLIFAKLKILYVLWTLNIHSNNQTLQKILLFISKENISNIMKLKWLDENTQTEIEKLIWN